MQTANDTRPDVTVGPVAARASMARSVVGNAGGERSRPPTLTGAASGQPARRDNTRAPGLRLPTSTGINRACHIQPATAIVNGIQSKQLKETFDGR